MDSSNSPTSEVRPPEVIDVNKLVENFVALRDRKRAMEAQHKAAVAPFTQVMDEIAGKLLAHMETTGTTSLKAGAGTCYQIVKQSATIKDGKAFREFVVSNAQFDLVDWRANPKNVFEFIKTTKGVTPPGLNASTYVTVGVRRPTETPEE